MTGMTRVGGVDASLTSTGIAIITRRVTGQCTAATTTVTSRGAKTDTLATTRERIADIRLHVVHPLALCTLVVIEGPSHGSKGGKPHERAWLWGDIVGHLIDLGVAVAVCPPTTCKKFATGNGQADKGAVGVAMGRLWPDVDLGPKAEDRADALALAHAGAVQLGWDVPTLARHRDALGAIAWPAQPVTEAVAS